MKKNQIIYIVVLLAIIGSLTYGLTGLILGGIAGYIVGKILPWDLLN
jgi:ABC-type antimicrobial peptide transport system permease subunit